MNPDQILKRKNRIAGSLFATAKFIGIVAVGLFYSGHMTASACCLGLDAMLLITCVVVCIRTMNFANAMESSNAHSSY